MERVGLDQNSVEIHLAEQLPQHYPRVVISDGVAGLADYDPQGS